MISPRGGYTVIEVMIVLAIAGSMLFSAMILFRGKNNQTQFNQAMYDLESKVQSVATEVKSGSFEDSGAYTCARNSGGGGSVNINPGSGSSGTNTDCLTLGRALQVIAGSDTITIYVVVGLRNLWIAGTDTGGPVESIAESRPEPVSATRPPGHPQQSSADLSKQYKLPGGAAVVSSRVSGEVGNYDIVSFYLSPQGGSSAGQGTSFTGQAHPFTSTSSGVNSPGSTGSENCIRQLAIAGCQNPVVLGQWDLCIRSADDDRRALLSSAFTSAGITTKLTFNNCT